MIIAGYRKMRFLQITRSAFGEDKFRGFDHLSDRGEITMDAAATNNRTQVNCAWCGGTGKWRVAFGNTAPCVVCDGGGSVSVTGRPRECWQCRGSGRNNKITPCLTCAGTGWELVVGQ
jgi:DnaJ-class molecular chaperone